MITMRSFLYSWNQEKEYATGATATAAIAPLWDQTIISRRSREILGPLLMRARYHIDIGAKGHYCITGDRGVYGGSRTNT